MKNKKNNYSPEILGGAPCITGSSIGLYTPKELYEMQDSMVNPKKQESEVINLPPPDNKIKRVTVTPFL